MLGRPLPDLGAAALQDGDVERVDARGEDDLCRGGNCGLCGAEGEAVESRGSGFADQPLEGPVAAALDLVRNAGQRDERAELAAAARELERRDVVLDAVVVASEGRRAEQIDRAVRPDEARARRGGLRRGGERGDDRRGSREERSHTVLLSGVPGNGGMTLAGPRGSLRA